MAVITGLNGHLPSTMLTVAGTGANGPQRLRLDASASWDRMLADAIITQGCLRSGYRTLAEQAAQDPALAAPVGQSQHGEGLAADVDEPARSGIKRNGLAYGWRIGFVPGEPWHAEYSPSLDRHASDPTPAPAKTIAPPSQGDEDPMFIKTSQRGFYTVTAGAVTCHASATTLNGMLYRKVPIAVFETADQDLEQVLKDIAGCNKENIPAPGYTWRA